MTNSQNFLFIENKGGIIIFYNLFYTMVYNTPPHPPKKDSITLNAISIFRFLRDKFQQFYGKCFFLFKIVNRRE